MGRPPRIDRPSIIEAAMAITEAEGLQAVTMQSVAAALGVTPMALYRHIGTKDDLVVGLVDRLVAGITMPPDTMAWPDRLHQWMRSIRSTAHHQPALFLILLEHRSPIDIAPLVNELRAILRAADVPSDKIDHVATVIVMVTIGSAAYRNDGWNGIPLDEDDSEFAALEQMVDSLVATQR